MILPKGTRIKVFQGGLFSVEREQVIIGISPRSYKPCTASKPHCGTGEIHTRYITNTGEGLCEKWIESYQLPHTYKKLIDICKKA